MLAPFSIAAMLPIDATSCIRVDARTVAIALLCLCSPLAAIAQAQVPDTTGAADWKLGRLQRNDGKVFYGLLQHRDAKEIEFVEVARPPGRPMFLVIHRYPPASVKSVTQLNKSDHEALLERIGPLLAQKSRRRVEAGRMNDVQLSIEKQAKPVVYRYSGAWFVLESTASEEITRRAVVRLEQMFTAFEQILPPRVEPNNALQIKLFSSVDQYRQQLQSLAIDIENPAFYSIRGNVIVAGSDLEAIGGQLRQAHAANNETRRRYERLKRSFQDRLTDLSARLKEAGYTADQIRSESAARRRLWDREYSVAMAAIAEADRRNDAVFEQQSQQMFQRLFHEAFHGYVENFVYPSQDWNMPRWLNEGLAQLFEQGQLEADTLRIDAPARDRLLRLQRDLTEGAPLRLAGLLSARNDAFLVTHYEAASADRRYLYSWGIAYYLMFERGVLDSKRLDAYFSPESQRLDPIVRFERLTGQKLPEFERQWREAILDLKPPPT